MQGQKLMHGFGVTMFVSAQADIVVFEATQIMTTQPCTINVNQLRILTCSAPYHCISRSDVHVDPTVRKGNRALT